MADIKAWPIICKFALPCDYSENVRLQSQNELTEIK